MVQENHHIYQKNRVFSTWALWSGRKTLIFLKTFSWFFEYLPFGNFKSPLLIKGPTFVYFTPAYCSSSPLLVVLLSGDACQTRHYDYAFRIASRQSRLTRTPSLSKLQLIIKTIYMLQCEYSSNHQMTLLLLLAFSLLSHNSEDVYFVFAY